MASQFIPSSKGISHMPIEKQPRLDRVEVLTDGHIQVREIVDIVENGDVIGTLGYHRRSYSPGDTIPDTEYELVQSLAATAWTPDIIDAQQAKVASRTEVDN